MASVNFPPKTIRLITKLGLSESTILKVFHKGEPIKRRNGMVKKFVGYEIGLLFTRDKRTGNYVITYVWKRDRR